MSIEIKGAEQLAALSKVLKAAGEKDLQRELSKAITTAMKPIMTEIRASARQNLPRRGGLAARVAKSQMRTIRRTSSSRTAGVRLQAKNAYALNALDRGRVRHPVFADAEHQTRKEWTWVTQQITPDWWTKPTMAGAAQVRQKIEKAMADVAAKIGQATK